MMQLSYKRKPTNTFKIGDTFVQDNIVFLVSWVGADGVRGVNLTQLVSSSILATASFTFEELESANMCTVEMVVIR